MQALHGSRYCIPSTRFMNNKIIISALKNIQDDVLEEELQPLPSLFDSGTPKSAGSIIERGGAEPK